MIENAKCTTLYHQMYHVKALESTVISTIVRVYHVYHVKKNISKYRRKMKNESNLSKFS